MAAMAASWISDGKDFGYFWSTTRLDTSFQILSQLAIPFRRISKHIFTLAAVVLSLIYDRNEFRYFWYTAPPILTSSFESIGLSGQDNKFKIDFQDGRSGRHLGSQWPPSWISDRNDFRHFLIYQSLWYFLLSFESNGFSVQQEKFKKIQDGGHENEIVLAIFDLQVTSILPIKFRVNWYSGSGEEVQYRFSKWPPWRTS